MKKIITAVIILSAMLMFAACSSQDLSDSKYVGTWEVASISFAGETDDFSAENFALTLNADGTGQFVSDESIDDITWVLTDDGFKTKGGSKMKFVDADDGNIKTKIIGAELIFAKRPE